jgi:ribosomal protein S18 acetylase RimI-like enzyme
MCWPEDQSRFFHSALKTRVNALMDMRQSKSAPCIAGVAVPAGFVVLGNCPNSWPVPVATQVSEALLRGISSLLPQLTSSGRELTAAELREITECPVTRLLVAKDEAEVVGMLSLVLVQMPPGLRAILEDLAVDSAYRRRGIRAALMNAARGMATDAGAWTVNFTSRPSREAGIRLYERLGYQRRDTGVFRLTLHKSDSDR